jgi:hypothetical protein
VSMVSNLVEPVEAASMASTRADHVVFKPWLLFS